MWNFLATPMTIFLCPLRTAVCVSLIMFLFLSPTQGCFCWVDKCRMTIIFPWLWESNALLSPWLWFSAEKVVSRANVFLVSDVFSSLTLLPSSVHLSCSTNYFLPSIPFPSFLPLPPFSSSFLFFLLPLPILPPAPSSSLESKVAQPQTHYAEKLTSTFSPSCAHLPSAGITGVWQHTG